MSHMTDRCTPPPLVGIDMGTTFSGDGIRRNERGEIIPKEQGDGMTPSVAFTDPRQHTGEAAEHLTTRNPCNTILDLQYGMRERSGTPPRIGIDNSGGTANSRVGVIRPPPPIGIDLGTTNSRVGVWRNEWVQIIPNERGNKTTPSCVAFTDTRRYIGEAAYHQIITNSSDTILGVKRLIGKRLSSAHVQNDFNRLPFKVAAGPGDTPMIFVQYKGKQKQFSALEISSMILHKMRNVAEAFLGRTIKNAVISVPACFNDSQRLATLNAGKIAGLNVMQIINEPTAAAIAYGVDNMNDRVGKQNILIFDHGGGTLDVSIITVERGKYEVQATVGDDHLGGVDFDNQLIRHCIEELKREHNGKNLNLNSRALGKLRSSCEKAKIVLSSTPETDMDIDSLLPGIHFHSSITRAKFEELNKDLFERCIDMVDKCLVDAKMYRSSIHDIVLIGGSTRIPKVQQMLRAFFDGKELSMRINSDEAVACGATIQAAIMSGMAEGNSKLQDLVVHDITTHSLGIDIVKQVIMIPRNTQTPTTKEVTLNVDQIELPIKVYEGEQTRIQDNNLLGTLTLNSIAFAPGGIGRITIYFEVDENGIFTISVRDKITGQRKINMMQITRDYMSMLSGKEIEKMVSEAVSLNSDEVMYKQKLEAKNALETLVNHLSKSITHGKMSKLDTLRKKKIHDAIGKTIQWLEKNSKAVGDEFHIQYTEHVSRLDKALNSPRCTTPGVGMVTNPDINFVHSVSRVKELTELTRDFN